MGELASLDSLLWLCGFMKFNVQVERWVKQMINRNKVVKVTAPEAQPKVGGSGCLPMFFLAIALNSWF